jgi:lipopolysaccharide biosynthesis glycosyltransferase
MKDIEKEASPTIHITCATDDSFIYPLAVMIVSVLENNKTNKVHIHLFSAKLSEHFVHNIGSLVASYNQDFSFYRLESKDFEKFPTSERISFATYYRLLMPKYLGENVERFLYLDADIIVIGNLLPLIKTDLKDKIFGAINDIAAVDWNMHKKHSIPEEYLYFNAGVLLVDKSKWNEILATEKVTNYIINNTELCAYHDQDGLNGSLFEYRLPLEPIWNQQIGLYFIDEAIKKKCYKNYSEAISNPIIVHFNGIEKPWHFVSNHPYKKLFKKFAKKISDIEYKEEVTLKKYLKKIIVYGIEGWISANKRVYYKTRLAN